MKSTKRYCQILEIPDNDEQIRAYIEAHSEELFWPEILEGIRAVGILEMELFIRKNTLVMVVEAPEDFDWKSAMDKLATLPRQAEWEAHVAGLQGANPNKRSDEKWQMMSRIFHLYRKKEE